MNDQEFMTLINSHQHTIQTVYNKYCSGTAISKEDVFQEVILETYKSINNFKKRCSFNTWLYNIARNVCIDAFRRQKTKPALEGLEDYEEAIADEDNSEELITQLQQAIKYDTVLDSLEEPYRSLYMMYLDGVRYKEMELQTGISENALRIKIHSINKRLRLRYG